MITNAQTGTNVAEIAEGVYRINTPVAEIPGGFSFNQYLIVDDEPLLFHTGLRKLFPLVQEAIRRVMPVEKLRYIAFSHFESDECGALNQFLAVAPDAVPLCSRVAAMVSVSDYADRPPRAMNDGERLSIGKREIVWIDAPHIPHGWETGYLFDITTRTLFAGDIFTQGGLGQEALVESDLVEPSDAFRLGFAAPLGLPDSWAHTTDSAPIVEKLASLGATTLANMHGSAWRGSSATAASMLREFTRRVSPWSEVAQ
ncbi:MAG TPA: MBL fold metallo-hydrolase [Thermoanaerobaculia bacterium]